MNKNWFYLLLVVVLLAACSAGGGEQPPEGIEGAPAATSAGPTVEEPQAQPPGGAEVEIGSPTTFEGGSLPIERGNLSSGSGACVACHTNMVDESGADVSIDRMWRSSMMANAARDPYWTASVRAEVISSPDYREAIEDKCATCHTPMARLESVAAGEAVALLDSGYLDVGNELHALGIDGISCNACHQILADNFGEAESFSGGYLVDMQLPMGERQSFGPYEVDEQQATIMQGVSGFIPLQGVHMGQAEQCGTCHTLYTPYLDANDQIAGEFPEQTVYQEWERGAFAGSTTCQDCHMPQSQGAVQVATTGGPPRSPFSLHGAVGGNAYVLRLFQYFGPEMNATAGSEHFGATLERVEDRLQNLTAALSLEGLRLEGNQLLGTIEVSSLAGHKFPTGFPSRRAWLHIVVRDAAGEVIFESGAVAPDGAIQGNDNDEDPARYEPHYLMIETPDQVQVYESIMVNTEGVLTTTLLRGAGYIKDNRLLPQGFDKTAVQPDIAPYGAAVDDADFLSGGDSLGLSIDLGEAAGPFEVTVELLYQSIGYRWADNLRQYEAAEVARFIEYYEAVPNLPVVVASAQAKTGE
jgi:hypothetical protein